MKQRLRLPSFSAASSPCCLVLPALALMLVVVPAGGGFCDEGAGETGDSTPVLWGGSTSVDSAQGTNLHVQISCEDVSLALWMAHKTAGTAGFTGFGTAGLDELATGMNIDSPYFVVGDLGLAGLGRFVFRPAGAGPLLPVYGRKPLGAERPDGTRYRGFVLGKDAGLMAVHPLSDTSRLASGAWFSPPDSPLSVLVLAGSEPGRCSDGWYEPDQVRSDRIWGAASLGMVHKGKVHRMSLAGALAASAGLPGEDSMAARIEAMLALGRLRLDAEVSHANELWRAPDGTSAIPIRLDLSALYRGRGIELSGAYRLERKSLDDHHSETGLRGQVLVVTGGRELRVASGFSDITGEGLPDFTLDTRWKPGLFPFLLPGLAIETAWKTSDGHSERFDTGASLKGGKTLRWSLSAGLRHDPFGRHAKGSTSVVVPYGQGFLRFGLKSDGWLPLAGELPDAPLVFSVVWNFSSP